MGGKGGFRRFKMVRGGGGLLGDLRWGERGFVSVVIGDVWRLKGLVFAWMLLCLLGCCCVCLVVVVFAWLLLCLLGFFSRGVKLS